MISTAASSAYEIVGGPARVCVRKRGGGLIINCHANGLQQLQDKVACNCHYGVATISRLLKVTGLFCKKIPMKETIFCKRDP